MKLILARSELWRGINAVLDAVPSKPTMPALANILLSVDSEHLTLAATDLELSMRTTIAAAVQEPGSIAVPARTLAEIIREWPESDIALEVHDNSLTLSGSLGDAARGQGSYKLAGMAAEDFPPIPLELSGLSLNVDSLGSLSADILVQMIQKTSFAVARDDTRPVLNGVLWRIDSQGVLMVATDGHRFAHYHRKVDLSSQISDDGRTAILPPGAISQISKLLSSAADTLSITFGDNQLLIDAGHTLLLTRLIEGPYVDYHQVIPQGNDKRLRIETEKLLPAVRRVSILSSSYTHQITLKLSEGSVELSANSPEAGGDAHEVIPVPYSGDEMDVGYNAIYLQEVLRRLGADEVIFELANHTTAAILRPGAADESEDYFCLLMPLRATA